MWRWEIESDTHCLCMCHKFYVKFPPFMTVCDVTACNYVYEHAQQDTKKIFSFFFWKFSGEEKTRLALLKLFIVARISPLSLILFSFSFFGARRPGRTYSLGLYCAETTIEQGAILCSLGKYKSEAVIISSGFNINNHLISQNQK